MDDNEVTRFNHNVMLVAKNGDIKLDRSANSRAELLKHSKHRVVNDLKNINKILPAAPVTYLPVFSELAPLLAGKIVSVFDVRSGYWSVELSSDLSKVFSFAVRHKRFKMLVLPQGSSFSAAIYQSICCEIISHENWEKFKLKYSHVKCIQDVRHSVTFFQYIDDLILGCVSLEVTYWCSLFIFESFAYHGVKLNPQKVSIAQPKTEILGW